MSIELEKLLGTQQWNPLEPFNTNMVKIENGINTNENNIIGKAECSKSNNIFSLTRNNENQRLFTFTATENFVIGDRFRVDGNDVIAKSTSGQELATGSFIIGSTVLCELSGGLLTIYNSGKQISILDVYPIGSIYMSMSEITPSELFGGSWVKIENTFLLASGTRQVGATGGAETHKITIEEMPSHTHTIKTHDAQTGSPFGQQGNGVVRGLNDSYTQMQPTTEVGGGQQFNIMPPYLVVNMWRRIA